MNVEMRPLVSVGVTTYNRPEGLRKALDCLLNQSYENLEIIVSEDCSPNIETNKVIEEFVSRDSRIKAVHHSENIGAEANHNLLVTLAAGKYFMWADDDDLCEPEMLETMVEAMEENPAAVLCGSDVRVIDADDTLLRVESLKGIHGKRWQKARRKFFACPISNVFYAIMGLYRTDVLQKYDIRLKPGWHGYGMGSEIPFLAKLAVKGEIISVPKELKYYRSYSDSRYVKEASTIPKVDAFFVLQYLRLNLIKIIIASDLRVSEKSVLLVSVVMSAINNFLRSWILKCLPLKVKEAIKRRLKK